MQKSLTVLLMLCAVATFAADPTPKPLPKPWNSSLGAGLAITSGNTDTKNYNLAFATKYDPKTKFVFKADALYLRGDSNGETQVDKTPLMRAASTRYPTEPLHSQKFRICAIRSKAST